MSNGAVFPKNLRLESIFRHANIHTRRRSNSRLGWISAETGFPAGNDAQVSRARSDNLES